MALQPIEIVKFVFRTRQHKTFFLFFTVNIIIWIYKTGQIIPQDTFICILMILVQGIGQTIYQQAVHLIEVDQ